MYLANIKLWNFRKYGSNEFNTDKPDLDLRFTDGLNVIIGANDSGKTAIIDAIKLVLKTHSYEYIRVEDKDFYEGASQLRIELVFLGLTDDEAKNFVEWIGWYRKDKHPYLKLIYHVKRTGDKILPADIKAGDDNEGSLLTAEAKEYLKITYLKPLRDAEFELVSKRNSRLSQILLGDPAFSVRENEKHELIKVFDETSQNLVKYFEGEDKELENENIQGGRNIKLKIDGYIKAFYGEAKKIEFSTASHDIKHILEKLTLSLKDEKYPGLGTLNRLFMAAELLHLNKDNWSGLRLGLIEELEAHLHPQAQMQVIEALQRQKKIQLILTTHSPNLASKVKLQNLIICNNNYAFPMGESYTKLNKEDYIYLEKFLDVTKSNLFFAKGVILVEGWAEELLLPSIAKLIGINLVEKGISIVNIANVGFSHYYNIFLRNEKPYMNIPVAIVTDCDIAEYKKLNNGNVNKISPLPNTNKVVIDEQGVKSFLSNLWTLEYCLYKSKKFATTLETLCKEIHSKTKWDNNFEEELAKKLLNKRLEKTKIAYKLAEMIDKMESNPTAIDANDNIYYIVKAINYAAGIND